MIRRILCPELCAETLREVVREIPVVSTMKDAEILELCAKVEACARFVEAQAPAKEGAKR